MFNHTDEQIRKGNESKIQILQKPDLTKNV